MSILNVNLLLHRFYQGLLNLFLVLKVQFRCSQCILTCKICKYILYGVFLELFGCWKSSFLLHLFDIFSFFKPCFCLFFTWREYELWWSSDLCPSDLRQTWQLTKTWSHNQCMTNNWIVEEEHFYIYVTMWFNRR